MRPVLVVLTWIALSTILGVLFAFSPLGFNHVTALLSLVLSLAVVLGLLWRQKIDQPEPVRLTRMQWVASAAFVLFAVRVFSQLVFITAGEIRVLSSYNLGDICIHLTHINYLASGPQFWPENPIFAFDKLHYPVGINLFNAELKLIGIETKLGIVLVAFAGSALTLWTLLMFNGSYAVGAFLFNGGLAGFAIATALSNHPIDVAWKSIPLAMFVTQRGLLYAAPAGLLLLSHWRSALFDWPSKLRIPFWAECLLYATMPIFHLHTFLFLSFLLFCWFFFVDKQRRLHLLRLLCISFLPATVFVYLITGFEKGNAIGWKPGWMTAPHQSPFQFWLLNFGLFIPAILALGVYLAIFDWKNQTFRTVRLFYFPSLIVFICCALIKFAPWEWDNTKLFFWAYLVLFFCLATAFLERWPLLVRVPIICLLFFSGFLSVVTGLFSNPRGYEIGKEAEWQAVEAATREFPPETVFAAYPTYNHPVLVNGHRLVMGYPGHLWSHGLDYRSIETQLELLMESDTGWQEAAKQLRVDYLFWGPMEDQNYPESDKEWEQTSPLVKQGSWGKIYDLRQFSRATLKGS